jgi:hypothetical protein
VGGGAAFLASSDCCFMPPCVAALDGGLAQL